MPAQASVGLVSFGIVGSAPSNHVFTQIGSQGMPGPQANAGAGAVWPVTVNVDWLSTLPAAVVLNLPGRDPATLTRLRSWPRGPAGFVWTGRGDGCSALFSALPGDRFRSVISCLDGPWGVETTVGGTELTRYDAFATPTETGPLPNDVAAVDPGETGQGGGGAPAGGDDESIDVLVLYTAAVRDAVGAAEVGQVMEDEVLATQLAMDNSTAPGDPLIADVHFVHAAEVSRGEGEDFVHDLAYLTSDPEPVGLRNYWAADVVMLVRETSPESFVCGRAHEPGYGSTPPGPGFAPLASGVVLRTCSFAPYNFQHEFGHVLGANHDPEDDSNPSPLEPWAYAHWANHGPEDSARTIVAYQFDACHFQCPQVLNYSNAAVTLTVPWTFHTGILNERENARMIAETAHATAQYRASLGRIFADGFE
jgi:hypothetical protein